VALPSRSACRQHGALILDATAILHAAERYAQNAEIAASASSAHKREVMVDNKVTYLMVID
jgi:hypothetical protein